MSWLRCRIARERAAAEFLNSCHCIVQQPGIKLKTQLLNRSSVDIIKERCCETQQEQRKSAYLSPLTRFPYFFLSIRFDMCCNEQMHPINGLSMATGLPSVWVSLECFGFAARWLSTAE